MSNSPSIRRLPPRPKITLPIPGQYGRYPQTPVGYASTPYNQTPVPMTPVSGQPQVFYSNRASEFVFTQFKGIKDFTKSGLSIGEKSVFWLYEKVSSWSKRWFTHIFLFVIVLLYSIAGAMVFVTIEGTHEDILHFNIRKERNKTIESIRKLWDNEEDDERWKGGARNELLKYEEHLYEYYKRGVTDRGQKVWTFWNAVFYCGTIYTTIERISLVVERGPPMEDSYTVHRRRKAATKKREKTPEPSSRSPYVESSEDEDGARRARMEKMAEDTERMEQMEKEKKGKSQELEERSIERFDDTTTVTTVTTTLSDDREEEKDTNDNTNSLQLKSKSRIKMSPTKRPREINTDTPEMDKQDEDLRKGEKSGMERKDEEEEGEIEEDNEETAIARKVEKRAKKRSKDRMIERHHRSTDSSEEKSEASPTRVKSSEIARPRTKKSSSRARLSDADKVSREKHSIETKTRSKNDKLEKKLQQHLLSADESTVEGTTMKKSESFPPRSTERPSVVKRSTTDVRKQVIPLSNDSLIEDFAKAQRKYLMRERSILDPDPMDEVYQDASDAMGLRKRKLGIIYNENEQQEIVHSVDTEKDSAPIELKSSNKSSWLYWLIWLPFFFKKNEKDDTNLEKHPVTTMNEPKEEIVAKPEKKFVSTVDKVTLLDFLRALKDVASEFKAFMSQNPKEMGIIRKLRNRCAAQLILIMIYCGLGAFVFRFTEGAFETFYKCGVKRVKRDFLDSLWNYSHNLREDDWKSMARKKLMEFEEQLHTAHEAGVHTYSGQRNWSFLNAVVYCLTVITTIGYGHISPSTTTGRAITIVYAIFGIPMFLIILADFGKLFTRGIKFLWAFVRRLYYTGSCRKVRRTGPVQEVMKGVQLVYDFATFRRPSQMNPEDIEEMQRQQNQQAVLNIDGNAPDTPGTPAMSAFAIDDEFNLPISVAIFILLGYIFIGATFYNMWEEWSFFESFYFVFISMSTIGFGDYVPKHPIFMMCSIIYLVFGLALTSMCINVVQVMLSDSFKQASQKIGATIGFEIAEEDGSVKAAPPPAVEVADIHTSIKESESVEKIAPKAKQEDVDL